MKKSNQRQRVWRVQDANAIINECLDGTPLREVFEVLEFNVVYRAMQLCDQNCAHAAKMLGIGRPTLVNKRRKHGLLKEK